MLPLLALFLAFVAFSDSLYLAIRRCLRRQDDLPDLTVFVLTRGLGPVAASVLTYLLLLFLPRRDAGFYAVAVILCFAVLAVCGRQELPGLVRVYRRLPTQLAARIPFVRHPWFWFVVLAFAGLALLFGVAIPITEHDSLVAAMKGRILLRDLSLHSYLALAEADPVTGFYYRSFRTPFLPCLYVWFGAFAGEQSQDFLARFVSPLYGIHALLLLAWAVHRRRNSVRAATWAVALLASTPIFSYMSYVNGVDPPRIYLAFLAVLWLRELLAAPESRALVVATGVVAGWSLYSHLLGSLSFAGGVLAYLLLARTSWRRRASVVATLGVVAFFAGVQFHYLLHPDTRVQLVKNVDSKFLDDWSAMTQAFLDRNTQPGSRSQVPSSSRQPPAAADGSADPSVTAPTTSPPATPPARDVAGSSLSDRRGAEDGGGSTPRAGARPGTVASKTVASKNVTEARGHGGSHLSRFLFGRLQLFTGIEYFGSLFWLFAGAVVIWLRGRERKPTDVLLLCAALITAVVVLSGARKLSWSNPRYIGSLVLVAAYFAGPWLADLSSRLRSHWPRLGSWLIRGGWLALLAPLIVATGIRGAKIEITNTGTFYSDFRSLRWVDAFVERPLESTRTLWRDYLGLRRTLEYLPATTDQQLVHAHDFFAAVIYMKHQTPADSKALVLRDARYFYYAERPGMVWFHPDIVAAYRKARDPMALYQVLRGHGITHVIVDAYSKTFDWFVIYQLDELLTDDRFVERVYEFGSAEVFRLRRAADRDQEPAPDGADSGVTSDGTGGGNSNKT